MKLSSFPFFSSLLNCAGLFARVILVVLSLLPFLPFDNANAFGPSFNQQNNYAVILIHNLPLEARSTLEKIKAGGPFPYRKDGITFGNYEGRLPKKQRGYYSEYTVINPGSRDRGARRIVAGAGQEHDPKISGEYYYTDDHYVTFKRIIER